MQDLKTLVLVLGTALGAATLSAQSKAVADIPFDFVASTVTLPAGTYAVQPGFNPSGAMTIENVRTGVTVTVLTPASNLSPRQTSSRQGVILFHHYGNQFFFSEISMPDGMHGRVVPGKLERELKSQQVDAKLADVSLPLTASR